jgi:hypothetical protein
VVPDQFLEPFKSADDFINGAIGYQSVVENILAKPDRFARHLDDFGLASLVN